MDGLISEHIIRQYLISHNYMRTLDAFEVECKRDRVRHRFQPSTIVTDVQNAISESNLTQLIDVWHMLQDTFFTRLDVDKQRTAQSFKVHVFKTYLVHAFIKGRTSKVTEFYEELASEFCPNLPEWQSWFALPYTPCPSDHPEYAMYFTKTWMDILYLSLSNFLCAIFSLDLCNTDILHRLDQLEASLTKFGKHTDKPTTSATSSSTNVPPFGDLLDDFNQLGSIRTDPK
ncbi:hypothetical protein PHET_10123 [Paragonimus heterotremus]|uniref:ARMC9 CTLH-like domain-containing protein n=1 Tax=Paragonimus heterotremus TaxID=100268 RepID=A0A8J4SUS3_9TREM|nr:hypothetical protein PHET_10123 [Paragonimus heterotremus]